MTLLNSVASLLLNQKTQNCRKPLHTLYAASSEEFFLSAVAEGCHNGAARAAPKKLVAPRVAPVYVQMSESLKPARGTVPEARVRVISEASPRTEPAVADFPGGLDSRYGRKWNPKTALAQRR